MADDLLFDATDASFAAEVLQRSHELPVVADFWAPWCGPCQFLGPVLERLIEGEFRGQLALARIDTDQNPEVSLRYGIRSIPAVKAFKNGVQVAEFLGALPEDEVRRFLRSLLPSPADRMVDLARAAAAAGDSAEAERQLRAALAADRLHPGALVGLGRLLEERGDLQAALNLLERVPGGTAESGEAARRAAALELRIEALGIGDEPSLAARAAADPADLEARYGLALLLAARGEHRAALEHLLEVVRRDRKLRDDGARKAMLRIFDAAGTRSPLSDEYRSLLASALY